MFAFLGIETNARIEYVYAWDNKPIFVRLNDIL